MTSTKDEKARGAGRRTHGAGMGAAAIRAAVCLALAIIMSPLAAAQTKAASTQPLPMGFRGISLGMGLDEVKTALKADALFRYRGDPDVSFLPQTSQYLIECEGNSYIKRAYFQFSDSRLFIMILVLDQQKLDHFSLWSALSSKYGQPTSLSPDESVWLSDPVRFSLERPLTVKYIDNTTFAALLSKGGAQKDLEQLSREKFLEQF